MRGQHRQRRGSRRTPDRRGGRRFNQGRRRFSEDRPSGRFRKGSKDFNRGPRRSGQRDQIRSGDRVRRRFTRDENGKRRVHRTDRKDNDRKPSKDLDGELMNYWIKGGKKQDDDGKNLAQQKLNEQLDNYWKKKEQNAQKVQQKKKQ